MFINCHYEQKTSRMHLWESVSGEKLHDTHDWTPYVFVDDPKSNIFTIDNRPVRKKQFATYGEYYEFCKDNHSIYENRVKPEIQFLSERYNKIPDDKIEVPKLLIYTIDIEVIRPEGFPNQNIAEDPIVSISVMDNITKEIITFGEKEWDGDGEYHHCLSEANLLDSFFKWWQRHPPDVVTGWNIWNFDLPYIINRTKNLFGEKTSLYKKLSPIGIVRTWKQRHSDDINTDIAGVHILDYYQIYRWYSPNKLESYTLDFVSKFELEEGKVDYSEFKDLRELYHKDWYKFVVYNRVDCQRVDQLEDKLGYIKLVQALSLLTKCPMKYYNTMTHLIEGALLTHYRRNKMCAPYFMGGTQEGFEAAFVKEPIKGMHDWVIDIDITSSYPSHIITLNMSNETYFGRIVDIQESDMVHYVRNREFPRFRMFKDTGPVDFTGSKLEKFNTALSRGLFAIAPCGTVFVTRPKGVIADVEQNIFAKRKEVKGQMKQLRNRAAAELDPNKKEQLSVRAQELFSLQWAIKILLNAVFGITAVPYSRYFNTHIAEAITSCGRHTIKQGQVFVNEYYNGMELDTDITDWVSYIDTDSLFIRLGDYMKITQKNWEELEDTKKIRLILEEARRIENYVNERIIEETQFGDYNSQVTDFYIGFKQEIIAKKALFVKKKKYAYWCVNEEGTPCDKLSVTGLDIVRSDSAEAIREKLKEVYDLILRDENDDIITDLIEKNKKFLKSVTPEEIAANIGINNIQKYLGDGAPIKGTPWHIKGVHNYRTLLKALNLEQEYEDIHESLKAKVVYLKPNQFNIETITFTRWPKEFDGYVQIDYDLMIEKFFLKKIGFLLEPMEKTHILQGRSVEKSIDAFFV